MTVDGVRTIATSTFTMNNDFLYVGLDTSINREEIAGKLVLNPREKRSEIRQDI